MSRFAFLGLLCAIVAACSSATDCEFCGRWQSHEARTLEEMERSTRLSQQQRQFYRDGFFGRLMVETTPSRSRAWFPDERPEESVWVEWNVVTRSGDTFVTRHADPRSGEWIEKTVSLQGDCYLVEQPELGFGEWFCRAAR